MNYAICTNPRSGSFLLAEGLTTSGRAGRPIEWLNEDELRIHRKKWDLLDPVYKSPDVILTAIKKTSTPNGVFGVKIHHYQFTDFQINYGELSLNQLLPNLEYVWLRRRDTVRQAISYYRAIFTEKWWDFVGNSGSDNIVFDHEEITRLYIELKNKDLKWREYFQSNNIKPLVLYYEDLVADYRDSVFEVLRWLGLVHDCNSLMLPDPKIKKQSDQLTEDWVCKLQHLYE